jgi:hypothetical protein
MRALPLCLLVLSACIIPVRQQGATTAPSGGYASSDPNGSYGSAGSDGSAGADGSAGYAPAPTSAPAAAHSGPTTVSVTIRSACSKTVPVFYGDKPKYGSGTTSSVSSNSVSSKTFQVGDQMWVLDESGNGAGSVTISENTRNVEINSSCGGLSAR